MVADNGREYKVNQKESRLGMYEATNAHPLSCNPPKGIRRINDPFNHYNCLYKKAVNFVRQKHFCYIRWKQEYNLIGAPWTPPTNNIHVLSSSH